MDEKKKLLMVQRVGGLSLFNKEPTKEATMLPTSEFLR